MMRHSPSAERVARIAQRLLEDGHLQYEIDAWRTALQLVAAHDQLAQDDNYEPTST